MLDNVKLELDTFDISVDDLEFLNQVVKHLEKLLRVGFFQVSIISLSFCGIFWWITTKSYVVLACQQRKLILNCKIHTSMLTKTSSPYLGVACMSPFLTLSLVKVHPHA